MGLVGDLAAAWYSPFQDKPTIFWVPTVLGLYKSKVLIYVLYMSYITLSCGPVLWSESELFTLIPSLLTTNCVCSL